MSDEKYDYKRFGCDAKRVGQAVHDILSKETNPIITAGEIVDAHSEKYREDLEKAIIHGSKCYENPFYVFVLTNKESWASNVVRNWFIPRQTAIHASHAYERYPNYVKTLYMINSHSGNVKICWSLPAAHDMFSIILRKNDYHPDLIKWIEEFGEGKLDRDSYSFDYDLINDF